MLGGRAITWYSQADRGHSVRIGVRGACGDVKQTMFPLPDEGLGHAPHPGKYLGRPRRQRRRHKNGEQRFDSQRTQHIEVKLHIARDPMHEEIAL